jgi:hypothetical protein
MVTTGDYRAQLNALRGAITEDAAELRLRWEDSRAKAVREWRGLTAVVREVLSVAPLIGRAESGHQSETAKATRRPAPTGVRHAGDRRAQSADTPATRTRLVP